LLLFFAAGIFFAGVIEFACSEIIGRSILKPIKEEEGSALFQGISKSALMVKNKRAGFVNHIVRSRAGGGTTPSFFARKTLPVNTRTPLQNTFTDYFCFILATQC